MTRRPGFDGDQYLNEQQAAVMSSFSPDQLGGIEQLVKRRGIDFGKINSGFNTKISQFVALLYRLPFSRSCKPSKD